MSSAAVVISNLRVKFVVLIGNWQTASEQANSLAIFL